MVSPVSEIKRMYQVITDVDDQVIIEATSNENEATYGYVVEGIDGLFLTVNDTEYLIEALTRATNWINDSSEDSK